MSSSSRPYVVVVTLALVLISGLSYAADSGMPDLGSAVRQLQQALSNIQEQLKGLQASVKELSKAVNKRDKHAIAVAEEAPVASPVPAAAADASATWKK